MNRYKIFKVLTDVDLVEGRHGFNTTLVILTHPHLSKEDITIWCEKNHYPIESKIMGVLKTTNTVIKEYYNSEFGLTQLYNDLGNCKNIKYLFIDKDLTFQENYNLAEYIKQN